MKKICVLNFTDPDAIFFLSPVHTEFLDGPSKNGRRIVARQRRCRVIVFRYDKKRKKKNTGTSLNDDTFYQSVHVSRNQDHQKGGGY